MDEWESKRERLLRVLADHHLEAVVLRRASSFAWATGGANASINTASTWGEASLLISPSQRVVLTSNIEAPRMEDEEGLVGQGWEIRASPWHATPHLLENMLRGQTFGSDDPGLGAVDLSPELSRLRSDLTPEEGVRFRELGRSCAEAMSAAVHSVQPGQTEHEIASLLAGECMARAIQPVVILIGVDDRIFRFRHPLPTSRRLDRYAMLVVCGRWKGLVCSLTRLVHFGRLPDSLVRKQQAVGRVDAALIAATRPGATLGDILARGVAGYDEVGFPDEWRRHHQGGPAGYEPRECLATPGSTFVVGLGQVFAWNPSVEGAKSEDTILVEELGPRVLTEVGGWPMLRFDIDGQTIMRPAILEVT